MKSRRYTGSDARLVLTGIITDHAVCSRIASQWDGELFESPDANLITGWCVKYLKSYGEPPNGKIGDLFREWAEGKNVTEARVATIERMLRQSARLAEREEPPTSDYILDRAGKFFSKARLRRCWEEAEALLDRNDVEGAYGVFTRVQKVELGTGSLIRLHDDYGAWRDALDESRESPLLGYSGPLQEFLGEMTTRENFLAFMGPDKSYKSFMILDTAFRALRAKRRVAFFEVGDMSQHQVMRRMAARFSKRPINPIMYRVPQSLFITKEGIEIDWKTKRETERLSPQQCFKAVRRACRNKDVFRLTCHPNSSIDIYGIESILKDWARDGWVADVVLIDYADILAPPPGIREVNEQIDATWKAMRRISQEFHCLLMTATQSNAAAYRRKGKALGKEHFSGRKTKLAHVTGMLGLSTSQELRKNQVIGMNWVARRDGKYDENHIFKVAGCLDIANPLMKCEESW